MKHRLQRLNELLQRELGSIIDRELSFDGAMVTIHQVDVSPDLRNARVYLAAIGAAVDPRAIVARLDENRPMLQRALAKRVTIKYTPILRFYYDDSFERGTRVIRILNEIDDESPPTGQAAP